MFVELVIRRELDETIVKDQRRIAIEEQQMEKKKENARCCSRQWRISRIKADIWYVHLIPSFSVHVTEAAALVVLNPTWEPTYELQAHISPSTDQPSSQVALHYRASITQATGEDWKDAALTLSSDSSFHSFGQGINAENLTYQDQTLRCTWI